MALVLGTEKSGHIVRATLVADNFEIMGSDIMDHETVKDNAALCVRCSSKDQIETLFTRLSDHGIVITPLHQNVAGTTDAELTDRFGINWILKF